MQGVGFEPTRISPSELESLALTTWLSLLYVLYSIFGFDGVFYIWGFWLRSFEQVRRLGIEPRSTAWKAIILPLNYRRLVQGVGIEPTRIAPMDLKAISLTARTSLLMWVSPQPITLVDPLSRQFCFVYPRKSRFFLRRYK